MDELFRVLVPAVIGLLVLLFTQGNKRTPTGNGNRTQPPPGWENRDRIAIPGSQSSTEDGLRTLMGGGTSNDDSDEEDSTPTAVTVRPVESSVRSEGPTVRPVEVTVRAYEGQHVALRVDQLDRDSVLHPTAMVSADPSALLDLDTARAGVVLHEILGPPRSRQLQMRRR